MKSETDGKSSQLCLMGVGAPAGPSCGSDLMDSAFCVCVYGV